MVDSVDQRNENHNRSGCSFQDQDTPYYLLISVIYLVIFVLGFFGNILVIRALVRTKKQKRFLDCLFINLAVANLVSLLILPFWAALTIPEGHRIYRNITCRISGYVTFTGAYASTFCLVGLSANRWLAITHPVTKLGDHRLFTTLLSSLVIWIMACALAVPHLVFQTTKQEGNWTVCTLDFSPLPAFSKMLQLGLFIHWEAVLRLVLTATAFALPVVLMVIFFVSAVGTARCCQKRQEEDSRARTLLTIVAALLVVFVLCWLPFHLISTLHALMQLDFVVTSSRLCSILTSLHPFATCLGNINGGLNPFVYVAFDPRFRAECLATLTCRRF